MNSEKVPDHLRDWWNNQYKAVQEFGDVLLSEESASPQLLGFFETLARYCPKLRSVRMTNALHAFWRSVPSSLAFELALKNYKTPTGISGFHGLVSRALPQGTHGALFDARFDIDSSIAEVLRWLEVQERERDVEKDA